MKLYWSRFNYNLNKNGYTFIYNTRTRGIISLPVEDYGTINKYLNNQFDHKLDMNMKLSIASLYNEGYINKLSQDTKDYCIERQKSYESLQYKLLFYFIPSWLCNFRCTYCHYYKNINKDEKMNTDIVDNCVQYIIKYIDLLYQKKK